MNSAAPRSAQAVFAGWCYTGIHRRPATGCPRGALPAFSMCHVQGSPYFRKHRVALDWGMGRSHVRSEEHTSELQSHSDLVCRLLLEKKKKNKHKLEKQN